MTETPPEPEHSKTCPSCGEATFDYERFCHRCGSDTWEP